MPAKDEPESVGLTALVCQVKRELLNSDGVS